MKKSILLSAFLFLVPLLAMAGVPYINNYGGAGTNNYLKTPTLISPTSSGGNILTTTSALNGSNVTLGTIPTNVVPGYLANWSIFNPTNFSATKLQGTISITELGAVGDGLTDCTLAISNALQMATNVYVPPGNFLTGPLTSSVPQHITFAQGAVLLFKTNSTGYLLSLGGTGNTIDGPGVLDGNLTNLNCDPNPVFNNQFPTLGNRSGLFVNCLYAARISGGLSFQNFSGYGVLVCSSVPDINDRPNHYSIFGCNFTNNTVALRLGLGSDTAEYGNVFGNRFSRNWISIEQVGANVEIVGNIITDTSFGWYLHPADGRSHNNFSANTCNHSCYGIYLTNCIYGSKIANNNFLIASALMVNGASHNIQFDGNMAWVSGAAPAGGVHDEATGTNYWRNNLFSVTTVYGLTNANSIWVGNYDDNGPLPLGRAASILMTTNSPSAGQSPKYGASGMYWETSMGSNDVVALMSTDGFNTFWSDAAYTVISSNLWGKSLVWTNRASLTTNFNDAWAVSQTNGVFTFWKSGVSAVIINPALGLVDVLNLNVRTGGQLTLADAAPFQFLTTDSSGNVGISSPMIVTNGTDAVLLGTLTASAFIGNASSATTAGMATNLVGGLVVASSVSVSNSDSSFGVGAGTDSRIVTTYGSIAGGDFVSTDNSYSSATIGSISFGTLQSSTNCNLASDNGALVVASVDSSSNSYVHASYGSISATEISPTKDCYVVSYDGALAVGAVYNSTGSHVESDYGSLAVTYIENSSNSFVYADSGGWAGGNLWFSSDSSVFGEKGVAFGYMPHALTSLLTANNGAIASLSADTASNIVVTATGGLSQVGANLRTNVSLELNNSIVLADPPNDYTNTLNGVIGLIGPDGNVNGISTNGMFATAYISTPLANAPTPSSIGAGRVATWFSNSTVPTLYFSYTADGSTSNAAVKIAP